MRSEVLNNVQLFNTRLSLMAEPEDLKGWVREQNKQQLHENETLKEDMIQEMNKMLHENVEYFRPKQSLRTFDVSNWEEIEDLKQKMPLKDAVKEIEVNMVERMKRQLDWNIDYRIQMDAIKRDMQQMSKNMTEMDNKHIENFQNLKMSVDRQFKEHRDQENKQLREGLQFLSMNIEKTQDS